MTRELYLDEEELRKGVFFKINCNIETTEGHRYDLEEWIGRGGNSAVFRGRHVVTDDEYALKFLLRSGALKRKRFEREIRLLNHLRGDHITKFYGHGNVSVTANKSKNGRKIPFLVMELADRNLQDVMREFSPLSYDQYAGQFRGLAGALASLHDRAIHRDIKPENILVVGERWLLSDYGLCTMIDPDGIDLTSAEQIIGPKFWLSPEARNRQLGQDDEIRSASDVFQMASVFWYVETGRHPSGIVTEEDWSGPTKLFPVLQRSLFHDYTKRPQNGGEFLSELEDALSR